MTSFEKTPELAYVIGVGIGDCAFHEYRRNWQYRIILTVKDYEFALKFSQAVSKVLDKERPYKIGRAPDGRFRVQVASKALMNFLRRDIAFLQPYIFPYPVQFLRGFLIQKDVSQ